MFTNLPVDVISDILLTLPDLSTLEQTVVSARNIYHVFQSRRFLILGAVYQNQLIQSFEEMTNRGSRVPRSHPDYWNRFVKDIRILQSFSLKRRKSSYDALALQISAWTVMMAYKIPMWHVATFAQTLVTNCERGSKKDLILKIAEDSQKAIFDADIPPSSFLDHRRHEQARFIGRLARFYRSMGLDTNAVRLLYSFTESQGFPSDIITLPALLKLLRSVPGTVYESKLVAHLSSCWEHGRNQYPNLPRDGMAVDTNKLNFPVTFTFEAYLHFVYIELNRLEDAVVILQAAIQAASTTAVLYRVISMARRTVKALKAAGCNQQALAIRRSVFDKAHVILRGKEVTAYLGWARAYVADVWLFGLPKLAVSIEEKIVTGLSVLPDDKQKAWHLRTALKALLKAYEEAGVPQDQHIRHVQESVGATSVDRESGPTTRYRMDNPDVPIMT